MTLPKEHRQVLDLLAQGKITADEAQRLMEKLNESTASSPPPDGPASGDGAGTEPCRTAAVVVAAPGRADGKASKAALKYLRIWVHSDDGDEVNIRVPLQIVRAGLKLTTVLPKEAREKINQSGIDLSSLNELEGDDLIEALRDLSIDVDASDGDVVRIFCE